MCHHEQAFGHSGEKIKLLLTKPPAEPGLRVGWHPPQPVGGKPNQLHLNTITLDHSHPTMSTQVIIVFRQ